MPEVGEVRVTGTISGVAERKSSERLKWKPGHTKVYCACGELVAEPDFARHKVESCKGPARKTPTWSPNKEVVRALFAKRGGKHGDRRQNGESGDQSSEDEA